MLLYQEGCYIDYQQSLMRPLELLPVEVSIKLPIQHFRRAHCGGPRGELDKLSRCLRSKSYFLHQLVGAAVTLLPSCHFPPRCRLQNLLLGYLADCICCIQFISLLLVQTKNDKNRSRVTDLLVWSVHNFGDMDVTKWSHYNSRHCHFDNGQPVIYRSQKRYSFCSLLYP
jgi:hypothetical protein